MRAGEEKEGDQSGCGERPRIQLHSDSLANMPMAFNDNCRVELALTVLVLRVSCAAHLVAVSCLWWCLPWRMVDF